MAVAVNVENFARAESDRMFGSFGPKPAASTGWCTIGRRRRSITSR